MSGQELWSKVDRYLDDLFVGDDPALDAALEASSAAGLPPIAVAPTQGKLLCLLARLQGAKRILEIGTLGGYSTIWLARALPADGRLITLEAVAKYAEVAKANIARAKLADKVNIKVGQALATLPLLAAEKAGPFDLVFIDADRPNNPAYLEWALQHTRKGSLIVCDNVVRQGQVLDARSEDAGVQGMRRFNELLAAEPRVTATAIQTVGMKGYDGFAVALVTADPST